MTLSHTRIVTKFFLNKGNSVLAVEISSTITQRVTETIVGTSIACQASCTEAVVQANIALLCCFLSHA